MSRIAPLEPPYSPEVEERLVKMMPPGVPPIGLFRTFAVNLPMTTAMGQWGGYELSRKLSLALRDREIVIDRTCARCRCEYEWGVHVAFFAGAAHFSPQQVASLTHGSSTDSCWTEERDQILIDIVDALHDHSTVDDELWERSQKHLTHAEFLDLTMLCGWYHAISFTANATKVDLEPGAPRFDDVRGAC